MMRDQILKALGRGYAHECNKYKPVDPDLITAMANEIEESFSPSKPVEVKEPKMMICPKHETCSINCSHVGKHGKNHTCHDKLTCPPCVPYEEKKEEPKESELEAMLTKLKNGYDTIYTIELLLKYLIKKEKEGK